MRFKIILRINKGEYGNRLPLNYQYELSSFIYKTIAKADEAYSLWLHDNGFQLRGKQFRLFAFSNLHIDKFSIEKENARLLLLGDTASFQISFLPEKSTEQFIQGCFSNQIFTLGDKKSKVQFAIQQVEMLPNPILKNEIFGEMMSPICLSVKNDEGKIQYLSPNHPDAQRMILTNLIRKYEAFHQRPFVGNESFEWQVLSEPKAKLITIKAGTREETKVKGYNCRFKLKADDELLKVACDSALGEKNSMGFGMVKIINRMTE